MSKTPVDQAARDRIASDLDTTLFVEAGAGSGKTSALVERVLALVTTGTAELPAIAAITFTEKAGAELRDRIRRGLQERAEAQTDPAVARRCRDALDQLDSSAIGTLHAFAQRLLTEHPIEAGLPPRVEILDEVESGLEFERRWSAFRDRMLADPALERTLLLFISSGVKHEALKVLAEAFGHNWDLVDERIPADVPEPREVFPLLNRALEELQEVCRLSAECTDPDDKLCVRLSEIAEYGRALQDIDQEPDLLEALGDFGSLAKPSFSGRMGRKPNWPSVEMVRARVAELGEKLQQVRDSVAQDCAKRLAAEIRRFTLQAAAERRAAGRLEFHDLLVLCRSLLRSPEHGQAVRTRLHGRYQRLLLDEFQDTDPIQIELAVRIAAVDPYNEAAGDDLWNQVPVGSGRLFVVGDPKQSIYRFRRADIQTFNAAKQRFGPEGKGTVALTVNFRTADPVINWVNQVFGTLMPAQSNGRHSSQPEYMALSAVRTEPTVGPAVSLLCRDPLPKGTRADDLRAEEAVQVTAAIRTAMAEGWTVDDGREGWRPAKLGDVAILVPARTSLPFLEDALEEAGIASRAESSSLIYATRAVRDLLMVLRAVDDPTDYLRVVSALRTPLLGCGDDDLFRFKVERKGRWSYLAEQPKTVPAADPVRAGLKYLRRIHELRYWHSPSELIDQIARDRRAMELGFAQGRPRDVWRRLRFVIDQARAWSESAGGSLRQYLHWVENQSAEGARVQEAILPETDDDAVRIMTIHAAKGLEFPITILSGSSTVPMQRAAPAEVVFPPTGEPGYKFGRHVKTEEYDNYQPIDEQMDHDERIRLLYVAATRARDHLVVSLCRKARAKPPGAPARTNAELFVDGMGALAGTLPDAAGVAVADTPPASTSATGPLLARQEWEKQLSDALAGASRPTTIAATALKPDPVDLGEETEAGLQKRPRDLDLPPWLKGRYGSAVGRAVHGVLQTIDLATGEGLEAGVAAQCEAEAIPDRAGDVRRLVEHALESATVRQAAVCPHWREVYACVPLDDGRLLEGYVDLLYRTEEGLVVVDYKTSSSSDSAEIDRRLEGYRIQGASYALGAQIATGETVARVAFLFLTTKGAVERAIEDLQRFMEEAKGLCKLPQP